LTTSALALGKPWYGDRNKDRAAFTEHVAKDFATSMAIGKAANIVINQ